MENWTQLECQLVITCTEIDKQITPLSILTTNIDAPEANEVHRPWSICCLRLLTLYSTTRSKRVTCFNIQELYILPKERISGFLSLSEKTAIISLTSINCLVLWTGDAVKPKAVPVHAMQTCKKNRGNLDTRRRWVVNLSIRHFTLRVNIAGTNTKAEWLGPRAGLMFWRREKSLVRNGIRTPDLSVRSLIAIPTKFTWTYDG